MTVEADDAEPPWLLLWALSQYQAAYVNQQQAHASERAEDAYSRCYSIFGASVLCVQNDQAAAADSERSEDDLQAQQDMAEWAKWITIATGLQVFVGLGGLVGLMVTIYLSNRATKAATAATEAGIRAADAAEKAYLSDNRPWIKIAPVVVGPIDFLRGEVDAQFQVDNVGKSPALNVRILVHGYIVRIIQIDKTHVARLVDDYVKNAPHNTLTSALVFVGEPLATRSTGRIAELSTPNRNESREVEFALVCTATYRSSLSDTYFHTSMTYMVRQHSGFLQTGRRYTGEEQDPRGQRLMTWDLDPRVTSVS